MSDVVSGQPLDVLTALCRRRGWALLLRSNGDPTVPTPRCTVGHPARLLSLDVVNPAPRDYRGDRTTRKRRLRAGDLLVRILLTDPAHLQEAATACLDQVGQRIQREAA